MTHRPTHRASRTSITTYADPEFESAWALLVALEENCDHLTSDPQNRTTIMEAFDTFSDHGLHYPELLLEVPAPDLAVTLAHLADLLDQLLQRSTTLADTLRYTRTRDLLATIHPDTNPGTPSGAHSDLPSDMGQR